jgi:hypothetical protein
VIGGTFVRPPGAAPLFGMNIGADPAQDRLDPTTAGKVYHHPDYQQALARLDIVVLAYFPGWNGDTDGSIIRQSVQAIKSHNPALKVAQYTLQNDSPDDPSRTFNDDIIVKLDQMNWWLRDAVTGAKLRWSSQYFAYDINSTTWTPADENGDRYPQWKAKRDFARFYGPVPEFDVWYFDGAMRYSRVLQANWRLDGVNVASQHPEVQSAFRDAQAAHWAAAAALAPGRLQLGNADNDLGYFEYRGKLGGSFLEAQMGKSWSLETYYGWPTMMERYFAVTANLKPPKLVGFNVWGAIDDYRFFRYAFISCRLHDGYFSYTDAARGYNSVPWFDEYEVAFGAAIDPPTMTAWSNGVHRRRYEHAMVLLNPNAEPRTVTVEPGWRRILARQDPVTNDGTPVTTLTLAPKDGIVLVRQ